MKTRTSVRDTRSGAGRVDPGSVTMSTVEIPNECSCSWSVLTPGPGREAISELRYRNANCVVRHEAVAAAQRMAG